MEKARETVPAGLPQHLEGLLRRPTVSFLSTMGPDRAPHATRVWTDTDGHHVLVSTSANAQEVQHAIDNARVAVAVADPDDKSRVYQVTGRVLEVTERGAAECQRSLAHRHLGPESSRQDDAADARPVVMVIAVDRVRRVAT